MSIASRDRRSLRVLHGAHGAARLRFRCSGIPVWTVLLERGGSLVLPTPSPGVLAVETRFSDAFDGTAQTVLTVLDRQPVRLVAALAGTHEGCRLRVEREPYDEPGRMALLNLAVSDIRCVLRFNGTPFVLATCVPPHAEQVLDLTAWDLTVTVNGITGSTLPIAAWAGDIVLGTNEADGRQFPTAALVTPPHRPGEIPLHEGNDHG